MFTTDNRTENFLAQMGVHFKYTNQLTSGDLSPGWDCENLARPIPIREEAVVEYATLMEGGSAAPAPILSINDAGKHDVLDGVQRITAAALAGTTQFSAYVVDSDSDNLLAAIRVLANARLQGRPEPPEWTRKRAIEVLVIQKGWSMEEVARMGGWKCADVVALANVMQWGFAVRQMGGPQTMCDSMLNTLAKHTTQTELKSTPKPIAEFLNVLKDAKFSTADAEPFIEDFFKPVVKKGRKFQVYTERLEDCKEDPEVKVRLHGRKGSKLTLDIKLRRSLRSTISVLEEILAEGEPLTYIDEFSRLVKDIERKLKKIKGS